jgi:hypothetical protein
MNHGERRIARGLRLPVFVLTLAACVVFWSLAHAVSGPECLIGFAGVPDANQDGGTLQCSDCDAACDADGANTANGSCSFELQVCANRSDASCTGISLKKVRVKGKCQGTSSLSFAPSADASTCGATSRVVAKLKKKGAKAGKCKVIVMALSSDKPRKVDKDVLTLVCNPAASGPCPTTTTITSTSTTSTVTVITAPCGPGVTTTTVPPNTCAPIVVGQAIPNTYRLQGTTGEKRCTTNAASNRFGTCTTDADCGATAGTCLSLPWVTADGQVMSFPTGSSTTFTVAAAGSFPTCEHDLCIPCGNPNASCPGVPGCEVKTCGGGTRINQSCTTDDTNATTGCPGATCPGCCLNPNGCIPRGTQGCCDQPGFIVPTFFVNILGGLCSRVDQIGCGIGKINTSDPQTGDLDVAKSGDTSDPGPDCTYGTGDDPAPLPCTLAGAGNDYKGKVQVSYGNGTADANGINYRLTTPELSTTWTDSQSPAGECANGSAYDDGEILVSQLVLKAEPSTAGASGRFMDLNGDGCSRAGQGFISSASASTDGPIVVTQSPGPLLPEPYDGCSGSVTAAVSVVFSGPNSPIRDIGFVAITPNMAAGVAPPVACSCTVSPGCPE